MKKTPILLILLSFFAMFLATNPVEAGSKRWNQRYHHQLNYAPFQPYLEDERHLQIPQWEDKNWYAEDWLVQRDGMSLVSGFYDADIFRDQRTGKRNTPILVVGPNFYRLSGFDKRRVVTILDQVYGITAERGGIFMLEDWYTQAPIGVFDKEGLRLH